MEIGLKRASIVALTTSLERRSIDACAAPCPRTAKTMTPRPADGLEGEIGRLGHPNTPNWTTESTISARQIAYCSPRKKPLVPSIGSMTHMPASQVPNSYVRELPTAFIDRLVPLVSGGHGYHWVVGVHMVEQPLVIITGH